MSAPSATTSGESYRLSWTGEQNEIFDLEESLDANFTPADTTRIRGTVKNVVRSVQVSTTYYYRVREVAVCETIRIGPWSNTVAVSVNPPAPPTESVLSVVVQGSGQGIVSSSPAGIACGFDCSEIYPFGTTVTLEATPDGFSTFDGWSGPCSGTSACVVSLDSDLTVAARFSLTTEPPKSVRHRPVRRAPRTGRPTPPNDDCVSATEIVTIPYQSSAFVENATASSSDPTVPCGSASKENGIWYSFIAPGNGTLSASTAGSNYDTVLTVYESSSCPTSTSSTVVACNDDTAEDLTSRVDFQAVAGQRYWFFATAYNFAVEGSRLDFELTGDIQLPSHFVGVTLVGPPGSGTVTSSPSGINCGSDCSETFVQGTVVTLTAAPAGGNVFSGWSGQCQGTGSCTFTVTGDVNVTATFTNPSGAPANDSCASATPVVTLPFSDSLSTANANIEEGGPFSSCSGSRSASVWYRFTSPVTGPVTIDTFGSGYDTVIDVFEGECGEQVFLTCNDDSDFTFQSRLILNATAGSVYSIMVTAYYSSGGDLTINLSEGAPNQVIDLAVVGPGQGRIVSEPAGIDCPGSCQAEFPLGTILLLTPLSESGSRFSGWQQGPCYATSGECVFEIDGSWSSITGSFVVESLAPSNNDCVSARDILSLPYLDSVSTLNAYPTRDGFFDCGYHADVWYRYTADESTVVTIRTTGSNYDTIIDVYTGSCEALELTGYCGYQYGDFSSDFFFPVVAGTTFLLKVSSQAGVGGDLVFEMVEGAPDISLQVVVEGGGRVTSDPAGIDCRSVCQVAFAGGSSVTLTATPDPGYAFGGWLGDGYCYGPAPQCTTTLDYDQYVLAYFANQPLAPQNNSCATATVVPGLPFSDVVDTRNAFPTESDPEVFCGSFSSVWYSFTPSFDGAVSFDSSGSDYSPTIDVYSGSCGETAWLNCYFSYEGYPAFIPVVAGQTYFMKVSSDVGVGTLTFQLTEGPPN